MIIDRVRRRRVSLLRAMLRRAMLAGVCPVLAFPIGTMAQMPVAADTVLHRRIDAFMAHEVSASRIPGVALAVVQNGRRVHSRGFGHDGRGHAIGGDTPFPIGSLTKSFTALLVRPAVEAGQLDADAPVQRDLPWFRVADADASACIRRGSHRRDAL